MGKDIGIYDVKSPDFDFADKSKEMLDYMKRDGFVVLSGMFDPELVTDAAQRIKDFAETPAVAGVPGYSKVDFPKRIFNPFLIGGPFMDLLLDERVVDLIEAYMDSECILAEANIKIDEGVNYMYFDLHSDFTAGWRKSETTEYVVSEEDLQHPVACTMAIYFHDTTEGAFSYCPGTHKMLAPRGADISCYPADEQESIRAKKVRLEGKAGDIVVFDDRGFHGPDHPSHHQRTVVLADYYRVKTFGYTQVSPMPVWTSDLGQLSEKQMRVLGAGADYMVPPAEYTGTRFRHSGFYPLIKFLVEHSYTLNHVKKRLKAAIR